ncbi:hypothetical protein N9924_01330 [bacterium]|nr:hypothetical protein [bacterium]
MNRDKNIIFEYQVITEDGVKHHVQASFVKVRKRMVTFYVDRGSPFITARFLKYKSFALRRRMDKPS